MGMAQTHKPEEDPHALPTNNLLAPPKGDICFINDLPPELLSHIFEVGSADDGDEDEGDMAARLWDNPHQHPDAKEADEDDAGVGMKEEDEDEEGGEETVVEGDSDATVSSDFPPPWPPFPIVVSHVCRHWRDVALSTPSLWTTIVVTPDARPPYELVSTLLERSKDVPINVFVNCEPHEDDNAEEPSDENLTFLYAMLIPHIHRWRTMEVSAPKCSHMYTFLSTVSGPSIPAASQLTTLELYDHEETDEFERFVYPNMSEHLTLFGGSAPLLTRIVLWGVHVDWSQTWIASASNLTEFELAFHSEDVRPSWAQFVIMLRGASALRKFSLRQSGPVGDPQEWFIEPTPGGPTDLNAPIQLLRVIDFTLAFHSQARAIGLLRKFYLPALKNLVLDFDDGDYTDFVNEITGPATTLSPTREQRHSLLSRLESLKIAGLPCIRDCIYPLYGELQNLTSLNISLSYLPQLFLDVLGTPCMLPGRGDIWLPRLTTLYVSGTSGDALRDLVSKRKDKGVPLSSLYVEESCDVEDEDVEWLKENVETFEFFEGSDDEDDVIDYEDLDEEIDEWSDVD